jgi:hypothetical protein
MKKNSTESNIKQTLVKHIMNMSKTISRLAKHIMIVKKTKLKHIMILNKTKFKNYKTQNNREQNKIEVLHTIISKFHCCHNQKFIVSHLEPLLLKENIVYQGNR